MKLISILLLLSSLASGCASMSPLPRSRREFKITTPVNLSKELAYQTVLYYLSKELVDSNSSIKIKDPIEGKIISKVNLECEDFLPAGGLFATSARVLYNFDFDAKLNKVRMTFEAVGYGPFDLRTSGYSSLKPFTNDADVRSAAQCTSSFRDELFDELASASKRNPNW